MAFQCETFFFGPPCGRFSDVKVVGFSIDKYNGRYNTMWTTNCHTSNPGVAGSIIMPFRVVLPGVQIYGGSRKDLPHIYVFETCQFCVFFIIFNTIELALSATSG